MEAIKNRAVVFISDQFSHWIRFHLDILHLYFTGVNVFKTSYCKFLYTSCNLLNGTELFYRKPEPTDLNMSFRSLDITF